MKKTNNNKMRMILYLLCIIIVPLLYLSTSDYDKSYLSPIYFILSLYVGFTITIIEVVRNSDRLKQISNQIQSYNERMSDLMLESPNNNYKENNKPHDKESESVQNNENKVNEQTGSIISKENSQNFYRPLPEEIPAPEEFISELIARTEKLSDLAHKPYISNKAWSTSAQTIKGNVRKENQDFAVCFDINDHQISILADGVGGLPGGKRAAFNAVRASTIKLIKYLGRENQPFSIGLETIALECIHAASYQLAMEGDRFNIGHKGLRTTLIVVIAGKDNIGYAYIGDGGGCLVSETGKIIHFLKPQKADGMALNVISASLGPSLHGEPISGLLERPAGSFIITGTDGVFDRLEPKIDSFPEGTNDFIKRILAGANNLSGNFDQLISMVLHELEEYQDKGGYIFNDNLSFSIIGNSEAPNINSPLWQEIITTKTREDKTENESEVKDQDQTKCKSDH